MPRQTIQVLPTDTVRVDSDWGYPAGIAVGDLRIALIGPKVIGKMIDALNDLQRELDDLERERNNEPTEAEVLSDCGPILAGFDAEAADAVA